MLGSMLVTLFILFNPKQSKKKSLFYQKKKRKANVGSVILNRVKSIYVIFLTFLIMFH